MASKIRPLSTPEGKAKFVVYLAAVRKCLSSLRDDLLGFIHVVDGLNVWMDRWYQIEIRIILVLKLQLSMTVSA